MHGFLNVTGTRKWLPICILNGSGKLRRLQVSEKENNHVREDSLDVFKASGAIYLETPWSGGKTAFWTLIHSLFLTLVIKSSGFQSCEKVDPARVGCCCFSAFANKDLVTVSNLIHTQSDGFSSKEKWLVCFSLSFPFKGSRYTFKESGKSRHNWMMQRGKLPPFSDSFRWSYLNYECHGKDIVPRPGPGSNMWVHGHRHERCEFQPLKLHVCVVYTCAGMHVARSSQAARRSRSLRMSPEPNADQYFFCSYTYLTGDQKSVPRSLLLPGYT